MPVQTPTLPGQTPTLSGPWSQIELPIRADIPWLNLFFSVDSPIFPGETIKTSWHLWSYNKALGLGQLTATIFVIDDNGVEHALSPSKQVEYDVKGSFGNSGVQQDTILANQLDQQLAHLLYEVGTKTIHLRLTGDGRDSGPYEADADLDIQPEAVDANWWAWIGLFDSNQTNFVGWNRDYPAHLQPNGSLLHALQGQLSNNGHSKMLSTVTLFEQEQRSLAITDFPPPLSQDIDAGAGPSDAAATQVVTFPTIKQTWQWLQDGTWIITGPLKNDFKYWVQFTLNDHLGNIYGPYRSSEINVQVSVSDEKIVEGVLALHEQNHAFADTIVSFFPFCQWAAGGAAIAQALALTAAKLAKDPPEANLRFREQVKVELVTLPAGFEATPALSTFRPLFDTTNRILATCEALSEVESRLLGARLARDQDAVRMQESSYRAFVDQMAADAAALPSEMPDMETLIDPAAFQRTLADWREAGIPADAQSKLRDAGVPEDLLLQMDKAIRIPAIADLLAEGPTLILGRVANSLGNLVQSIQHKTELTLSAPSDPVG